MREEGNAVNPAEKITEIRTMNSSVLAYVGDAVYELFVRSRVVEQGQRKPDVLNKQAVRYSRAESQAAAAKGLEPVLTEDEQAVLRRSKNKKITSMPGHLDPGIYKWATGLEGLFGYLYLSGQNERLEELLEQAAEIIDAGGDGNISRF